VIRNQVHGKLATIFSLLIVTAASTLLGSLPRAQALPHRAQALGRSYPVGQRPLGVAVDDSSNILYVTNSESNYFSTCHLNFECSPSPTDYGPIHHQLSSIAIDNTTHWAYVTNTADNSISVIQRSIGTRLYVPVGRQPVGIAVDSATHRVYVANYGDDAVTVLDGFCGDLSQYCGTHVSYVAIIPVGGLPVGVALDTYTHRLFVTDSSDDVVTVVNTETLAVVAKVSVGRAPYGVAIDSGMHRVFVSNSRDGTVSVIDENVKEINYTVTSTPAVVQTVGVGLSPHGVAVDTTGDVIVANNGDNTVSIFRDSRTSPVRSFPVGAQPEAAAVDPSVHTVIVTNAGDNTVSEFTAPDASDIIYVPLRLCVLAKTSYAGTSPGFTRVGVLGRKTSFIDPASIHTISATDRVYLTKDVVRPSLVRTYASAARQSQP
jgi:YVTN family beta-propeller protein